MHPFPLRSQLVVFAVVLAGLLSAPAADSRLTLVGSDRMDLSLVEGDTPLFHLQTNVGGAEWRGARLTELATVEEGGKRVYGQRGVGVYAQWYDKQPSQARFDLRYEAESGTDGGVVVRYTIIPEVDAIVGMPGKKGEETIVVGATLPASRYFRDGTAKVLYADGSREEFPLPPAPGSRTGLVGVTLSTASGQETRLRFEPPALLHMDRGEFRVRFAGTAKAGEPFVATMRVDPPPHTAFEPGNRLADTDKWFPLDFPAADDFTSPSPLGMQSWLDAPAGKHGWLQMDGRDLRFADGTKAKFWGINICNQRVFSEKAVADRWADRCAKFGVNLVRFHKFLSHMKVGAGLETPEDGTQFVAERLGQFDYFSAALARRGVYYGWSQFYAYLLSPADKDRVLAYDEIMGKGQQWFRGSTIMLVNFAPDLQDLHIKTLLKLLNHTNSVTGVRYAEDPALAYIEIQNEDSIFFPGLDREVKAAPTYYALMKRQFSDWLAAKYGSEEAWKKAWDGKVGEGEKLAAGNVDPFAENIYDLRNPTRRVLDVYAYLYDAQTNYYKKVSKAIRDAGYGGVIVGSCWQTATFLGHLHNVRSDRETGMIDRHNYGGGNMMNRPGAGLLSAGFQQVADRPFHFSEWGGGGLFGGMEAVPVIGLIGMGVQGWDASSQFASNEAEISRRRFGGATCDEFLALAQYPAIARALYRGDLTETDPVGIRKVSLQGLDRGDVGFTEQFSLLSGANIKEFVTSLPQEALAVGPVVLDFVDGEVENPVTDRSAEFIDTKNRIVRSASGQVHWDYSERGYFTVNTPGTQAVIGYGAGKDHALANTVIRTETPFTLLYVSAASPGKSLANADQILVTALGRVAPEGEALDEVSQKAISMPVDPTKLGDYNNWPHVVEPVSAVIELKRKGNWQMTALDHGGRPPANPVVLPGEKTADGIRFRINGHDTKTMFYLLEEK